MLRLLNSENRAKSGLIIGLTRRWMSSSIHKTTVMSFGDGSHGALGLPASTMGLGSDAYEPTPIPGLPSDVCTIAAGHYHSLAVTSEGHLWAWGRNNEAQLGRSPLSPRETWHEPKKVEGLKQVRVKAASASGVISTAIGEDGSLWVWGRSKRGQLGLGKGITESELPSKVKSLIGQDIVKVSLGWGHGLALTKNGKVFGWGYYADGRLGKIGKALESSPLDSTASKLEDSENLVLEAMEKEKDMPIIWEPGLIEELHDLEVSDISCGLDHSLILCRDGTLLSGGSNVYKQLGRTKQDLGFHRVETSFNPRCIACGLGHSLAICESNVVSWGWNMSGQLGREGSEDMAMEVEGLGSERSVLVSGGRVHSVAVTEKKEVWSWGSGRNGRLGLGSSCDEGEPMLVDNLEGFEVLQAVAGFDFTLVLVAE